MKSTQVFKNLVFVIGIFCTFFCVIFLLYTAAILYSAQKCREKLAKTSQEKPAAAPIGNTVQDYYLDVLKKHLVRYDSDAYIPVTSPINKWLAPYDLSLVRILPAQHANKLRTDGRDWPADQAETMIGLKRLNNLEYCIKDVLKHNVPGDFIETGVWRGGATIFMRAALKAYGDTTRKVWVSDSFQGVPKPDEKSYPMDVDNGMSENKYLMVSLPQVKQNFARYDLLDDQVRFLPGWFRDTLPTAPIDHLAILRVDGDLYESTTEALHYLYPKVSRGGYIIDDDYGALTIAKKAVDDFRKSQGITDELKPIDWTGVYWQKH